jgi:hypothetical protein
MDALAGVFAVALTSVILMYLAFNLSEEEHPFLRLILLLFSVIILVVMPKIFVDASTVCTPVVNTSSVNGSIITYTYMDHCVTDTTSTSTLFMKIVFWTFRAIATYVVLFVAWSGWGYLMDKKRGAS